MSDEEKRTEAERLKKLQKQLKCADALRIFGILVFVIGLIVTIYGSAYCTWYYYYTLCNVYYYNETAVIVGCVMMVVGIVVMVISAGLHRSIYQQLPAQCRGRFLVRVVETVPVDDYINGTTYTVPGSSNMNEDATYPQQQYYQQAGYQQQQGYPVYPQQYPAYPQQYSQNYPPAYEQAITSDGNDNNQQNNYYKQPI